MTELDALLILHNIEHSVLTCRQKLDIFEKKSEDLQMAVSADVAAIIIAMDTATTAIAARIAALVAKQTGLSAEDKAAFQAEVDKLTALGSDPTNPIP